MLCAALARACYFPLCVACAHAGHAPKCGAKSWPFIGGDWNNQITRFEHFVTFFQSSERAHWIKAKMTAPEIEPQDLKYGPHSRQVVQLWQVKEPSAPLLVFVHGSVRRLRQISGLRRSVYADAEKSSISLTVVHGEQRTYRSITTLPNS